MHPSFKMIHALKADQDGYPTFYSARYGRCRSFLSRQDADAYDNGWLSYAASDSPPTVPGPFATGWWDHFAAEEDRMFEIKEQDDE